MRPVMLKSLALNPRNTLSIDVFARVGSSAFTSIFVVRHLGPTQSGSLIFATAMVAIGTPFAAAGTNEVLFQRFADALSPATTATQPPTESVEQVGDEWLAPAWEIRIRRTVVALLVCIGLGAVFANDLPTIGLSALSLAAVPFELATVRLIAHRNLQSALGARLLTLLCWQPQVGGGRLPPSCAGVRRSRGARGDRASACLLPIPKGTVRSGIFTESILTKLLTKVQTTNLAKVECPFFSDHTAQYRHFSY
jgi:hypothetical protein